MDNGGSESGEANAISHSEESAEVERPFLLIGLNIKLKIGVDDACDVILLARSREQLIGENGECLGLVHIKPIGDGCHDIHDDYKSDGHICSGEPWACKRAPKVGGNGRPVEAYDPESKPVKPRAQLLG